MTVLSLEVCTESPFPISRAKMTSLNIGIALLVTPGQLAVQLIPGHIHIQKVQSCDCLTQALGNKRKPNKSNQSYSVKMFVFNHSFNSFQSNWEIGQYIDVCFIYLGEVTVISICYVMNGMIYSGDTWKYNAVL